MDIISVFETEGGSSILSGPAKRILPHWTNWQSRFSQKEECSPFDSEVGYQVIADVAQLVEQRIENPCVTGSNPVFGTKLICV